MTPRRRIGTGPAMEFTGQEQCGYKYEGRTSACSCLLPNPNNNQPDMEYATVGTLFPLPEKPKGEENILSVSGRGAPLDSLNAREDMVNLCSVSSQFVRAENGSSWDFV